MKGERKMKELLKNWLLVGICVLLPAGVAVADDTKPIVSEHNFEVSLGSSHFEYEEPEVDMQIDGFMYGVVVSGTHHNNNKLMLNGSFDLSYGSLDYDGQTWGGTPVKEDTRDWIVELRGSVGYDIFLHRNHLITPYIGLGFRYWNNDIEGSGGYEREVKYLYSPIGVKTISRLSHNWKCGINVEYDLFLWGQVTSHLSDVHPGFSDPSVDQNFGDGYGVRCSCALRENFARSMPYL